MIIVGEKINGTLSPVKAIILNRDTTRLLDLAERQASAGANFIDVNVGTGVGTTEDEIQSMRWAVENIQNTIETPLCIDSADPKVLEAAMAALDGRPAMINSTKASRNSLDAITPIAADHNAFLVALAMDEGGIPKTTDDRLGACEKIASACEKRGVPIENVYFDPLVMPISTDRNSAMVTLGTISAVKTRFPGAKTITGLSNVSYGLPRRRQLNSAYLNMCIFCGLDAAIIDPLDEELMSAVKTGEVLVGKDRHCRRYLRAFRK